MNKSILIVNNDQTIRESLSLFLTGEGFNCQTAEDGLAAEELVQKKAFDIVLLDLNVPRQHGLFILDLIKEKHPKSTVIILTPYYHIDDGIMALRRGATKLLIEPIDFQELLDVINQQLDLANS